MRLTGTLVLVLGVLAFAGSAYADNRNGEGNDGAAPGNSGTAPGQVKKQEDAAATTAPAATTTTTAAPTTTAATNATGVKPANDTAHDTHAEAQSDKTKQYGNGQTAGQIAEKNGAGATTLLHGPGNSQPHKATPCSGGRHEVDVHALKSHRSGSCNAPAPTPTPHPNPTPDPGPPPTPKPDYGSPAVTTTTTAAAGGESSAVASNGATKGVLSETQHVGHAATLPFTGQRLWLVVLLGAILILTGLALREIRTEDAPVESGHDHTDRSRHAADGSGASLGGRPGR